MRSTTFFTLAAAIFTASSSAAKAATDDAFEITNTSIRKVAGGNVTVEFTIHDPDPLTNATAQCSGSWPTGSHSYPSGSYDSCGNSSFAWNMYSFDALRSFQLGVQHVYTDPAVGEPPYDQIENFGKANITKFDVSCKAGHGHLLCLQTEGTVIQAPIYASVA